MAEQLTNLRVTLYAVHGDPSILKYKFLPFSFLPNLTLSGATYSPQNFDINP